jgi:hypothetical protein
MKVVLGFHPDREPEAVALRAFGVADRLIMLLDGVDHEEIESSIMSEFDASPQDISDAVLGRGEVEIPVQVGDVDKEFL